MNDKVEVKQYYENNKENLWNQSEIVTENILQKKKTQKGNNKDMYTKICLNRSNKI